MSKTTAVLFVLAVLASQTSAASGPCQTLTAMAASGANPFQIKQDIKQSMASIELRHQPFLGISPRIAILKSAFEQLARDHTVLDKKIAVLLKDRNFTSGHPGQVLAATSKYERLIKDIDTSIQMIERQSEMHNQSLTALQAEVAQFATYILGDFIKDLEAVGLTQQRISKNLNIADKDVQGYLASALKLFNTLETLPQNLQNTQQALASLEIKASSVNSTMDNRMRMMVGQYRTHGQTDYQLDPESTDIPQTSDRALFERIPEPGELVVIEGRFSATPAKVSAHRSNIKGQKFALIDRTLVLNGIRHGDIYTDGTTTYGVIGFVQGRVMLQLIESKSYLPSAVLRNFRSMDTKTLTKSFRKEGYNSYNRPLLLGDLVGHIDTGKVILIEDMEFYKKAPREVWYLVNWDPKDTGGIAPGLKFWDIPVRTEVTSEPYFTNSEKNYFIRSTRDRFAGDNYASAGLSGQAYLDQLEKESGRLLLKNVSVFENVSRVDGITQDGTFLVVTQRYASRAKIEQFRADNYFKIYDETILQHRDFRGGQPYTYETNQYDFWIQFMPGEKHSVVSAIPMTSNTAGVELLKQRLADGAHDHAFDAPNGKAIQTYEDAQELIRQFELLVSSSVESDYIPPTRRSYQDILTLVERNPKPIPDDAQFKLLSQVLPRNGASTPGKGYRPEHY